MVHLYRAAPESASDTNTYLMYGLGAVAVILGLIFLYRYSMKRKSSDDSEPTPRATLPAAPTPTQASLVGTSWKFVSPVAGQMGGDAYGGNLTFNANGSVAFDNGGSTSRTFMSGMTFSNGKLSGKMGDSPYTLDVVYNGVDLVIKSPGAPMPDYKLAKVVA